MGNIDDRLWLADFLDQPIYRLAPLNDALPLPPIPINGQYTNKIVVIHDLASGLEGKPEQVLLQKIMQAVSVSLEESGLINIDEWKTPSLQQLIEDCMPEKVICFGEKLLEATILIQSYEPTQLLGTQVLIADSLPLINKEVLKKKQLWNALQQMFK